MSEQVEQQRTVGNLRLVATMQALVDEPLEAVVAIRHRGFLIRLVLIAVVAILLLDQTPLAQAHAALFVCASGLLIAAGSVAVGAIVDARSPLRLGALSGALAVSGSTVYVAHGSTWTGRPLALSTSFPRAQSTIALGGTGWGYRPLTVIPPGIAPVRLEASLPVTSGEISSAISALGRPPEAQWRPDPGNPGLLRWWDGGVLTRTTTPKP